MSDNALLEKWNPLIEAQSDSIRSVSNKEAMATLLESEENYIISEANMVGDIAQYTPILVPAVRRVFPNLLANEIVGVQPLTMPTGYAYALRYTYGNKTAFEGTDRGIAPRGGMTPTRFKSVAFILDKAFDTAVDDVTTFGPGAVSIVHIEGHNTLNGMTVKVGNKVLVDFDTATNAVAAKNSTSFSGNVSGTTYNVTHAMNNEAGYNLVFSNYIAPVTTAQGETMGGPGASDLPFKEMRMGLERVSIEVQTKKLKAEYSIELAQDLKNVHGLDAEAELINIMEYEVTAELDRELVNTIYGKATITPTWNYGVSGNAVPGNADGRWEQEKFRTLYTRIIRESNQIALATRKGAGNFIIASSNAVSALESLPNFMYSAVPGNVKPTLGVAKVGTLDGRFTVYLDSFATNDFVVVGYKGQGQFDTGIVYCPYVPLMLQKVTDPNTMQPKIAFMTRDAICGNLQGSQNYYRIFSCDFSGSTLSGAYDFGIANF